MAQRNVASRSAAGRWREYRGSLLFLFLMLVFRSAWADWVSVPTGSMNPTILEGDRVLVDKHVYGLRIPWTLVRLSDGRDPTRGEIVVFDSPRDGTSLVKRVIGVPGDVIALDDQACRSTACTRTTRRAIASGYPLCWPAHRNDSRMSGANQACFRPTRYYACP